MTLAVVRDMHKSIEAAGQPRHLLGVRAQDDNRLFHPWRNLLVEWAEPMFALPAPGLRLMSDTIRHKFGYRHFGMLRCNGISRPMSVLGHSRRFELRPATFAIPLIATELLHCGDSRSG